MTDRVLITPFTIFLESPVVVTNIGSTFSRLVAMCRKLLNSMPEVALELASVMFS